MSTTSSQSSNEPGHASKIVTETFVSAAAPAIIRSEIRKCHVTGFVNFIEGQPSVGRFKAEDEEPMTIWCRPRSKTADIVAQTIAPECNVGVFNPVQRDPATSRPAGKIAAEGDSE